MNRAKLFAVAFLLAAFSISLWMVNHIPHSIILHINSNWHISLVGEEQISTIKYDSQQFWVMRQDSANLWLEGQGTIQWLGHQIHIEKNKLRFNKQFVERSRPDLDVNLMLYPDGHVTKGKATIMPTD